MFSRKEPLPEGCTTRDMARDQAESMEQLGGEPSKEIAAEIPKAILKVHPQWGHGLYEAAKDFNQIVFDF